MTFSAIDSETQQRYTVKQLSGLGDSKTEIIQRLVSPITLKPVRSVKQYLRQGANIRAHFRHTASDVEWPENIIFDDEYGTIRRSRKYVGTESQAHLNGKLLIAAKGHEIFNALQPDKAVFEHRIEIPGTNKYRIIDVAFVMDNGDIIANEIQISPITPQELTERTNDYREAGIVDVMWWFGPKASTPENKAKHLELTDYSPGTIRTVVKEKLKTIEMNFEDD